MSSDCEQIQFYIQQQFDIDLSFEDEQAILAHLDSCNLCNRYRSQIEQVIVFAQDLPLSEEYLLAEYETLVARVVEQLPKPSLSALDLVLNFFGKVLGLKSKGTSIVRSEDTCSKIQFPHVNRAAAAGFNSQESEIDALTQLLPGNKGLGKKFGIEFPEPEPNPAGAVTLAESIRQNIGFAKTTPLPEASAWRPLDSLMPDARTVSSDGIPLNTAPPAIEQPAAGGTESGAQQFIQERESSSPAAGKPAALAKTSGDSILGRLAGVLEEGYDSVAQTTSVSPPAASAPPVTPVLPPEPATPALPLPVVETPNTVPTTSPPSPPAAKAPNTVSDLPASTAQPPAAAVEPGSLLKNVRDEDIDTIFTQKLGVAPEVAGAVVNKGAAVPVPPPQPQKHETPNNDSQSLGLNVFATTAGIAAENKTTPAKTEPQPDTLFSLDDEMMDKIFAENLGIESAIPEISTILKPQEPVAKEVEEIAEGTTEPAAPPPPPAVSAPIPAPPAKPAPVSAIPSPPPVEVEGLGRLDSHAESSVPAGPSQIGAAGKFLLDRQDIQNLEKLTQSNLTDAGLRVLTPEAAQDLQILLQRIRAVNGVTGSVIVGHDGIVVSSDLPNEFQADSIAVWSLGIYLNTDNAIKKMGRNSVQQLIAQTSAGYLTITDFGAGILATITSDTEMNTLLGVMRVATELMSA